MIWEHAGRLGVCRDSAQVSIAAERLWLGSADSRVFTRYSDSLQQHGPRCVSKRIFIPKRGGPSMAIRACPAQPVRFISSFWLSSFARGALGFKFLMLRHHVRHATLIMVCESTRCRGSVLSPVELEVMLNLAGASRKVLASLQQPFA